MNVNAIGANILYGYIGGYGQKSSGQISEEVAARIAKFDADGNGTLNSEESDLSSERFSQADSNGDGSVTEKELLAMMQSFQLGGPLFSENTEDLAANIIAENDADSDGALSLEESEGYEGQFTAADADGDGLVTKEELVAMMQSFKPGGPPPGVSTEDLAANIIAENDADGDGALGLAESEGHEGQHIAADADGDGVVTKEELVAMIEAEWPMGPPSTEEDAARRIAKQDADGDGVISASESGVTDEIFNAIDTNEDGVVSQDELEAALVTIQQALDDSGLGRGPEAIEAAGGIVAYREEVYRITLEALTGGSAGGVAPSIAPEGDISAGPYPADPGIGEPVPIGPYPENPDGGGPVPIGPYPENPDGGGPVPIGPYPEDPSAGEPVPIGPYPADPDGSISTGPSADPDDITVGPYPADPDGGISTGPYPANPGDGISVGPYPANPDGGISVGPYRVNSDMDSLIATGQTGSISVTA
jgi:Ca2+-binding EF-hand superfamily protein